MKPRKTSSRTSRIWKRKPFREADAARVRYLDDKETKRLVNACPDDLRRLVTAALLTGCRFGELAALVVTDYNADAGSVHVRISKSGKPRHVALNDEGKDFFTDAVAGRPASGSIFIRDNGSAWAKNSYQRAWETALTASKVGQLAFHELRHTYASRAIMAGVALMVVARQLGHSDTRMVEKHYGHLAPNYVADAFRAGFGSMGITEKSNVTSVMR